MSLLARWRLERTTSLATCNHNFDELQLHTINWMATGCLEYDGGGWIVVWW